MGVQVVSGDGVLDGAALNELLDSSQVSGAGLEYSVVAIMGPQSSGKSTLLNHAFGTTFVEMDAARGRSQTTQGIWLDCSPKLKESRTLILDLEGTDGRERGEDDTNFERQSALFALAVADVLLINLWHHDIGREHGSGKPLLKTVLQENLKLFNSGKRKSLVFVIRDRSSRTPLEALAATLREDLDKLWASIAKPGDFEDKCLDDVFDLNFTSLPNFEEKEEEFEAETTLLRSRFKRSNDDCYLPPETSVPGSALLLSFDRIWSVIKEDKNLDLPAHRVMVATVRCDQAMLELAQDFAAGARAGELQEKAAASLCDGFGAEGKDLVEEYVDMFDGAVEFFEPSVCGRKRGELRGKLLDILRPAVAEQYEFAKGDVLKAYSEGLAQTSESDFAAKSAALREEAVSAFEWLSGQACVAEDAVEDARDVRSHLLEEMDYKHAQARSELKAGVLNGTRKALTKDMHFPLVSLLEDLPDNFWPAVKTLRERILEKHAGSMRDRLGGLGIADSEVEVCAEEMWAHMRETCETLLEEGVKSALPHLKAKFVKAFCYDTKNMPRVWNTKSDIPAVNQQAKMVAAKALSQLAVSQMESKYGSVSKVTSALEQMAGPSEESDDSELMSLLASNTWPDAEEKSVLLTPVACRSLWNQLESEVSYTISQAVAAQEAFKLANARSTPLWALGAIAVLGWNEFVALLYNPVLLILVIMAFVFARAIYVKVDVPTELEKGLIPAIVSISVKLIPIVIEVAQQFAAQFRDVVQQQIQAAQESKEPQSVAVGKKKDD